MSYVPMKKCNKCDETKPITEFYKCACASSGYDANCKACRDRAHTAWLSTPEGKIKVRLAKRRFEKKRRKLQPQVIRARAAVAHAVRSGKIPKPNTLPCSECGGCAVQYHHPNGYDEEHKLDVVPVCLKCHRDIHRAIRHAAACAAS